MNDFQFPEADKCLIRALNKNIYEGKSIQDIFPWSLDGFPEFMQMEIYLIGAKFLPLDDRRQKHCQKELKERFFIQL